MGTWERILSSEIFPFRAVPKGMENHFIVITHVRILRNGSYGSAVYMYISFFLVKSKYVHTSATWAWIIILRVTI